MLVFESKAAARSAFRTLQKSVAEEPSAGDGTITAKAIPITIWPAEYRISQTLGKGDGLKGILRMRWARAEDVKKKGARNQSQFYKKYGQDAGKSFEDGPRPAKKRRDDGDGSRATERARLDEELDRFLADDDEEDAPPAEPVSRMRSDYIGDSGKTLLERTEGGLASRLTAPLPRRSRGRRDGDHRLWDRGKDEQGYQDAIEPRSRRPRSRERRQTRQPRTRATAADLDAELDAFLQEK